MVNKTAADGKKPEARRQLIFENWREYDGALQKRPHQRRGMDPAAETVSKASALRGGEVK